MPRSPAFGLGLGNTALRSSSLCEMAMSYLKRVVPRLIAWCILFALAMQASYRFLVSRFSSLWFSNGIMLASLTLPQSKNEGWFYHLTLLPLSYFSTNLANSIGRQGIRSGLLYSALNTGQCVFVYLAMNFALRIMKGLAARRNRQDRSPYTNLRNAELESRQGTVFMIDRDQDLAIFAILAMSGSLISASIAAQYTTLTSPGDDDYLSHFRQWASSDLIGNLLTAPLVISAGSFHCYCKHIKFWQSIKSTSGVFPKVALIVPPTLSLMIVSAIPVSFAALLTQWSLAVPISIYMAFPLVLYNSSVLGAVGCAVSMFCLGVSVQAAIVYFPRRSFGVENSIVDQLIWAQVILVVIWLTSFGFVALLTQLYVTIEAVEKCVRQRTIELSDALSDLRSAQAATEKLSQLKTNFINYVAHEIRNPLHAVLNLADDLMFDLRHPPDGLKWPKLDALPSLPLKGFDPLPHPLPVRKNLSNIVRFEIVEGSQNDDRDPYSLTTECQEPVDMPSARPRTLTITNHHIRSVQSIIVSTQHMLALVNDMLEIGANECTTRKELRKMVRPVEVNLVELLTGKIFPLLKSAAESNDVRLTAAAEPSLPQLVVIDPDRLEQIIGNLLGHSFKNTSPHSRIDVRVASRLRRGLEDDTSTLEFGGEWRNASLELQRVESICAIPMHRDPPSSPDRDLEMQRFVPAESTWTSSSHSRTHNIYAQALRPSERYISTDSRLGTVTSLNESNATTTPTTEYDEELVLQIRTYGRGIPSEKLEALFEPYTQASLANEREVGGSGLGLAVTYLLVKAMGGRVTARSREGEGISMTVVLPLVRASFEGDNQTRSVLSGEGEQDSESERKLGEDAGKVFSEVTLGGTSSCDLSIGAISGKPSMLAVQPASEPSHIVHDGQMLSVSKTSPNQYEVRQEPAIPILNPPKATESVALGTTQDPEHNALRNVVMVVEDEPINRRILVRILKKLLPTTFIIKEAEDGLQAVRLLNPSFHEHAEDEQGGSTPIILDFGLPPTTIACVLLDVVMPRMDGYEAARHLRLLGCNAPIVVTTANEATGTREKFEKELENAGLKGIEGAMQKPFGRADVERALRKCAVLEKELN